jgi:carbohydrate-selective porin OprB
VVGGVAAELGGGKFANGGMSAAFSRMFNDTLTLGISFKAPVWIQKVPPHMHLTSWRHN